MLRVNDFFFFFFFFCYFKNLKYLKFNKISDSDGLHLVVQCELIVVVVCGHKIPADLVFLGFVQINAIVRYMTDENKSCI
jgi:hypothetical protein